AFLFIAGLLIIHFFRRRRLHQFEFSTLRFFATAVVRTSRIRKIRKLLLFLVRVLCLTTLILLFAGLHNKSNRLHILHNPGLSLYTWIDPTMSMEYAEEEESIGQYANDILDSLIMNLPSAAKHY